MGPRSDPPGHLNSVWLVGRVEEPVDEDPVPITADLLFCLRGGPSLFVVAAPLRALEGRREDLGAGAEVRIIGRLRQQRWRGPEGEPRATVVIVGELVEPLTRETQTPHGASW